MDSFIYDEPNLLEAVTIGVHLPCFNPTNQFAEVERTRLINLDLGLGDVFKLSIYSLFTCYLSIV